ncbi:MAG: phosphatase domain-containing protein [Bdellovibrionota bacterium]
MAASAPREKLSVPYPLVRVIHRTVEKDYRGPVFVWDIDKTYLDTRFSQLRHALKIPFELGVDKKALPGMVELLHGLREGASGRGHHPLYFVSASPWQLGRSIEKKMLLDGVEYDGIYYKNPLRAAWEGGTEQFREQVAYKLSALFLLYQSLPGNATLHLFGDDAEKDALIYCLFADTAAGRLRGRPLHDTLLALGIRHEYASALQSLAAILPVREAAGEICIHLVRVPDGSSLAEFDTRVTGFGSAGAVARKLALEGLLAQRALARIENLIGNGNTVQGTSPSNPQGYRTPAKYLVL